MFDKSPILKIRVVTKWFPATPDEDMLAERARTRRPQKALVSAGHVSTPRETIPGTQGP